jgi:hypothetical protein
VASEEDSPSRGWRTRKAPGGGQALAQPKLRVKTGVQVEEGQLEGVCPNKLAVASWLVQLVYKKVIWNLNLHRCVCPLCYLCNSCLWCVSVWFTSTQDLGLWICSQIWAGQVQ